MKCVLIMLILMMTPTMLEASGRTKGDDDLINLIIGTIVFIVIPLLYGKLKAWLKTPPPTNTNIPQPKPVSQPAIVRQPACQAKPPLSTLPSPAPPTVWRQCPNCKITIKYTDTCRCGDESAGYIYILTNKAMPDYLKIGYTQRNPKDRAWEMYEGSTGVPHPFDVAYERRTTSVVKV